MTPSDLPKLCMYYMASPYTRYHEGIWQAYKEAARIAGKLAAAGLNVYSPIVHCHPLAVYGGIDPLNHQFWMKADAPFVAICEGLIVAKMPGWQESKGVTFEVQEFVTVRKPIYFLDPATLELTPAVENTGLGVSA